jgi:16S rRNA (adenine1518-N6/adenine1519-N6)-dimethyltransferase
VEEARVGPGDTVLEIGPGRGALTEGLARKVEEGGGRLILVELDAELAERLSERYGNRPRVQVIHGDILGHATADLVPDPGSLRVVGNIPYNLTSPILFHLLHPPRPREVLLMVQAEVADRILSDPGTKAYGALTVGVRSVAEVERVLRVPSGAFRPSPKVDSTVVRIRPVNPSPMSPAEEGALRGLTRAVFQWRRKQLGKTLREHPDLRLGTEVVDRLLTAARVRPTARPEEVAPSGFVAMAALLPGTGLP